MTLPSEPLILQGAGPAGVGLISAVGTSEVDGPIEVDQSSSIGAQLAGSTLTLGGAVSIEGAASLSFIGAGNTSVSGAISNGYTLSPFTASLFLPSGTTPIDFSNVTNVNNALETTPASPAMAAQVTVSGALSWNSGTTPTLFNPAFTTTTYNNIAFSDAWIATITVNVTGTYSFASIADDFMSVWIHAGAASSASPFLASDRLLTTTALGVIQAAIRN